MKKLRSFCREVDSETFMDVRRALGNVAHIIKEDNYWILVVSNTPILCTKEN